MITGDSGGLGMFSGSFGRGDFSFKSILRCSLLSFFEYVIAFMLSGGGLLFLAKKLNLSAFGSLSCSTV